MQFKTFTKTLAVTALLFVASSQAWAHTALVSSKPLEGSSMEAAPKTIELSFTEDVKLLRVVLTHEENEIDINFKPITVSAAKFSIEIPELSNGTYSVSWAVLGGDSHRVNGDFSFGIGTSAEEHADHGEEHTGHAQHGSDSHNDH